MAFTRPGRVGISARHRHRAHPSFASAPERLWTLLGRIQAPTLVLHATHTFPFVAEGAARLQSVNPHVQTQQVNGTHCFMQEQPANTAALIKSFLQTT